jgi:hypothetical protein
VAPISWRRKSAMKNFMNKVFFIASLALIAAACSPKLTKYNRELAVDSFDFQYFTGKARIKFDNGDQRVSGIANIRVSKDSVIWVSLSPGLGLEVARVLINNDSIFFVDRINKRYATLAFDKLSEKYKFDLNYRMVESVILGNLVFPYQKEALQKTDQGILYKQQIENYKFENVIGNKSRKLENLTVEDVGSENTFSVKYSNFQRLDSEVLPYYIEAILRQKGETAQITEVEIDYSRATIEEKPLRFPFRIPSKYDSL